MRSKKQKKNPKTIKRKYLCPNHRRQLQFSVSGNNASRWFFSNHDRYNWSGQSLKFSHREKAGAG